MKKITIFALVAGVICTIAILNQLGIQVYLIGVILGGFSTLSIGNDKNKEGDN